MGTLLVALAMDLGLGDPPNRLHPVAWLGWVLATGRRLAPAGPPWLLILYGATLVVLVAAAAAAAAATVKMLLHPWPVVGLIVEAWLAKCTFSLKGLFAAVARVGNALSSGDLDEARRQLGRHLVSRPTSELDRGLVASAAIESLAENLTDSWMAPLCFLVLGGLPAAWAYRAVNTADAMIGYRESELEHLGKAAARLDDLLNLVPARLAALALVAGAAGSSAQPRAAWAAMRRDGARTASPNAGRTMAAMAGALGVTLEKPGHYCLGRGPAPDPSALGRAMRVAALGAGFCLVPALLALWALA